jgi:mannose-6-phosphate isomerase-like protein (cupin superfamily)
LVEKTDGQRVGGVLRDAASYRAVECENHARTTLVTIPPGAETGDAVHDDLDERLIFLDGDGTAIVDGQPLHHLCGGEVFVPAGIRHNVRNTGSTPLRLYTVRDRCS